LHTSKQLDESLFAVSIHGADGSRDEVFPEWHEHDRLGVVVHEPFGAVGACHLIQLAITAYYDVKPRRRDGFVPFRRDAPPARNPNAIYPEIYLFHVGRDFGNHSIIDVWPARKEVVVEADARVVLDAINDRAITRLAVPDGAPMHVEHEWKEPAAALDRIAGAFAYSASGRVADPDVVIAGTDPRTEANAKQILNPDATLARALDGPSAPEESDPDLLARSYPAQLQRRQDAGRDGLDEARERRSALRERGLVWESYRRINVETALQMLVPE
jgi:hypothetical protein